MTWHFNLAGAIFLYANLKYRYGEIPLSTLTLPSPSLSPILVSPLNPGICETLSTIFGLLKMTVALVAESSPFIMVYVSIYFTIENSAVSENMALGNI